MIFFSLPIFCKWVFALSSPRDSSDYRRLGREDSLWLIPPLCFSCLSPTFHPGSKHFTCYVVMPQLSTNLQVIKHIAFIINSYASEGNVLSLNSWGTGFSSPCFLFASTPVSAPNGPCILRPDKCLIRRSFCGTYEKRTRVPCGSNEDRGYMEMFRDNQYVRNPNPLFLQLSLLISPSCFVCLCFLRLYLRCGWMQQGQRVHPGRVSQHRRLFLVPVWDWLQVQRRHCRLRR